jgi:hypothetical protein
MNDQTQNTDVQKKAEEPTRLLEDKEPETEKTPADSRRVLIRRKMQQVPKLDEAGQPVIEDGKPVLIDEPMIRVPYEFEGGHKHIDLPADRNRFELPALVARAVVDTGHFEQDPETRTRLK